jgi:hypothetical protein
MPVTENKATEEQKQQDQQSQDTAYEKAKSKIFESDVFKSLDLPSEVTQEPEEETKPEEEEQPEEPDVVEETLKQAEETEETDEEVIPKSKVQKRFDELTAKIKYLESQAEDRARLAEPKDDVARKLENMSTEELKQARIQARMAQLEYKDDKGRLSQLLDLEARIEDAIHDAPARFQSRQVGEYNKAVERIADQATTDGIDLSKESSRIREIALDIYQSTPEFQASIQGQAKALHLAYKHFKEINTLTKGKQEVSRLKSQVNTFKKKTSLDSKTVKSNFDRTAIEEMRKKASHGTLQDKTNLIKNDPRFNLDAMIPDEYKQ